jgi:hypothetical protein
MLLLSDLVAVFLAHYNINSKWAICGCSTIAFSERYVSLDAHFNALFYNARSIVVPALQKMENETIVKMRSVTTRKLKKSATVKKRVSSPQRLNSTRLS